LTTVVEFVARLVGVLFLIGVLGYVFLLRPFEHREPAKPEAVYGEKK
jgi:hypothetical protein